VSVRAWCPGIALAAALTATAPVACGGGSGDDSHAATARSAPRAPLFGCAQSVRGGRLAPRPGRDLVAGPFTYYRFRENMDGARLEYQDDHRSPNVKIVALVAPGRDVTLSVPEDQRDFMSLLYTDAGRVPAVRLRACRSRRPNTQFAGGMTVDFAKAAGRERCAVLEVWVKGRAAPLRRRLFQDAVDCG
jgi:hypothetical protein